MEGTQDKEASVSVFLGNLCDEGPSQTWRLWAGSKGVGGKEMGCLGRWPEGGLRVPGDLVSCRRPQRSSLAPPASPRKHVPHEIQDKANRQHGAAPSEKGQAENLEPVLILEETCKTEQA